MSGCPTSGCTGPPAARSASFEGVADPCMLPGVTAPAKSAGTAPPYRMPGRPVSRRPFGGLPVSTASSGRPPNPEVPAGGPLSRGPQPLVLRAGACGGRFSGRPPHPKVPTGGPLSRGPQPLVLRSGACGGRFSGRPPYPKVPAGGPLSHWPQPLVLRAEACWRTILDLLLHCSVSDFGRSPPGSLRNNAQDRALRRAIVRGSSVAEMDYCIAAERRNSTNGRGAPILDGSECPFG